MSYILNINDINDWSIKIKNQLKYGDVVFLKGEMGSGKTTLISNIVKKFNSKIDASSPTFSLFNVYPTKENFQIIHIDAYRLENKHETFNLGLDYYNKAHSIYMIEWAEKLPKDFMKPTIIITLTLSNNINERIIHLDQY
tara:strand:- start:9408 stop:9827 length:420 start_codon:yes stop_codon:yes gene_type:complete